MVVRGNYTVCHTAVHQLPGLLLMLSNPSPGPSSPGPFTRRDASEGQAAFHAHGLSHGRRLFRPDCPSCLSAINNNT